MSPQPSSPLVEPQTPVLETGEIPDQQLHTEPSRNSSESTTQHLPPNSPRPNPPSTQRSWDRFQLATVNSFRHQKEALRRRHSDFRDYVHFSILPRDSRPNATTVFSFLCVLISFAVLLCMGARFPRESMLTVILVFGATCSVVLPIRYFLSNRANRRHVYRPNLGNTITIVILTIPTFTLLYAKLWYPQRRTEILTSSTDSVTSVRFPSVAVFQRSDWSSQAILRSGGSKCFLGWHNEAAPACASLDPKTFGNSTQCTCKELWYNNDSVFQEFIWQNTSYRYVVFDSPKWLISTNPTYLLLLQTFFDYNATKALLDSSTVNPTLHLAIYDPTLGLQRAFETGYTRMNLINANGIVAVNIGLRLRQGLDGVSAYDFTLGLSSSPARDLVCDVSSASTYQYPCHLSLFVQVPNFDRTIVRTRAGMGWSDVAASAGAYFSFVQFVSWILSAQAFIP
ncbi:hypothetical protein GLAREA_11023 [Glarea lozoyensis ATCC 20868]|uniref:Uncharacterized protein n=1 Tax=Glarea lozoyensis (strain ATCC 20868 / MF5171) TaxID=1116229 RepID=S3DE14_GLAL2|nr:uncharacterized protein GLAREA_11023 [Glarea lozoyensis ATCC 20868]EPE35324.1 hypothetical protein GLAREA_11023 [Glarea lozoyensis ATCC 20868]